MYLGKNSMKLVKNYMLDDTLRHALNELTQETFGFDFESWVTEGYFEGDYIPYSFEEDGVLVANVSVNRMDFLQNGETKHYLQLGTVMTKKEYRKRGLARKLMETVLAEYEGKCDGIYLYGNLGAVGFYDALGFKRGAQYRYFLKDEVKNQLQFKAAEKNLECCFCQADAKEHKQKYQEAVRKSVANSAFEQENKYGLQMFYTAGMEQVYYSKELDCYIVLEKDDNTLILQSVICTRKISMEQILTHLPMSYDKLMLGFTPCQEDVELFCAEKYDGGDDYRFFYMGSNLESIEAEKLYFPELSHA